MKTSQKGKLIAPRHIRPCQNVRRSDALLDWLVFDDILLASACRFTIRTVESKIGDTKSLSGLIASQLNVDSPSARRISQSLK